MENNLIYKVYDFFNNMIQSHDIKLFSSSSDVVNSEKICPITKLDISMQSKNSKFLSTSGVKWYFENNRKVYDVRLAPILTESSKNKDISVQFSEIAHSIRNSDSNPRNNTKRAIRKLLNEHNSLFNNLQLIDKQKLQEAGMSRNSDC